MLVRESAGSRRSSSQGSTCKLSTAKARQLAPNGEGNLIIGYDEDARSQTGSHDLILGTVQEFTSYGGVVGGADNAITAPFASVLGGGENIASGQEAAILGGGEDIAQGPAASVSGGLGNDASGMYSSTGGGEQNTASAFATSVSGGNLNHAKASYSWIGGGIASLTEGEWSAIGSGYENIAEGKYAWLGGGAENVASGETASISGGGGNVAKGRLSSILGEKGKKAEKEFEALLERSFGAPVARPGRSDRRVSGVVACASQHGPPLGVVALGRQQPSERRQRTLAWRTTSTRPCSGARAILSSSTGAPSAPQSKQSCLPDTTRLRRQESPIQGISSAPESVWSQDIVDSCLSRYRTPTKGGCRYGHGALRGRRCAARGTKPRGAGSGARDLEDLDL